MTGYTREQLIGRTSIELGLIADPAARAPALGEAAQTSGVTFEVPLRRKDGAIRVVEFTVQLLPGERLVLAICRDATQRIEAQARLRASEERFHAAVESLTDPYYILSPVRTDAGDVVDFRYEYASQSGYALAGPRQLLGRKISEVDPGFAQSPRCAAYLQVVATGMPRKLEVVVPAVGSPDGRLEPRLLEITVTALGENIAVLARDVTELRRVQAELQASEERFRTAVESTLDSFTIVSPVRDSEGEIVDFRYRVRKRSALHAGRLGPRAVAIRRHPVGTT